MNSKLTNIKNIKSQSIKVERKHLKYVALVGGLYLGYKLAKHLTSNTCEKELEQDQEETDFEEDDCFECCGTCDLNYDCGLERNDYKAKE